jgi:hypothetical protein
MKPNPNVVFKDLDGEAVLLDLSSGTYFGLNEVGTRVWQLAAADRDEAQIVAAIAAEYAADPTVIAADVAALLADLRTRRLILDEADEGR